MPARGGAGAPAGARRPLRCARRPRDAHSRQQPGGGTHGEEKQTQKTFPKQRQGQWEADAAPQPRSAGPSPTTARVAVPWLARGRRVRHHHRSRARVAVSPSRPHQSSAAAQSAVARAGRGKGRHTPWSGSSQWPKNVGTIVDAIGAAGTSEWDEGGSAGSRAPQTPGDTSKGVREPCMPSGRPRPSVKGSTARCTNSRRLGPRQGPTPPPPVRAT